MSLELSEIFKDPAKFPKPPLSASSEPDTHTKRTEELVEAHLAEIKQNTGLRKDFAWAIFGLVITWLVLLLCIVIFHARGNNFRLEPSEFITLVSTTNAAVLGLLIVVLKYLFPNNKK